MKEQLNSNKIHISKQMQLSTHIFHDQKIYSLLLYQINCVEKIQFTNLNKRSWFVQHAVLLCAQHSHWHIEWRLCAPKKNIAQHIKKCHSKCHPFTADSFGFVHFPRSIHIEQSVQQSNNVNVQRRSNVNRDNDNLKRHRRDFLRQIF